METTRDEPPEKWARRSDVQELLGYMLQFPGSDHREAISHKLPGALRNGHVAGLFAVADSADFKKHPWKGAAAPGKAAAYHTWLFHLLGGSEQNLVAPPMCKGTEASAFSHQLRHQALHAYHFKKGSMGRFWLDLQSLTDAARKNSITAAQEAQLHELRFALADLAWLRLPATKIPIAVGVAAGGGDGDPAGTQQQVDDTERLLAFAMGTHERLGEGYSSREEPCAIRLFAGDFDMLGRIAGYVRGVPPRRRLEPPAKELFRLRQLTWRLEQERHGWRAATEQLQSELSDVRKLLEQSERRAAGAHAHAVAERRLAESQIENLSEIHQVRLTTHLTVV